MEVQQVERGEYAMPAYMIGDEKQIGYDAIVYVIDDDADVREALKELLESVGLKCELFRTRVEFLRRGLSQEVSCLILDVRLPESSGLDLQSELLAANINIPIIFLTAYADIPMTVRALKAGAAEFLTKPVREQDLLDAVRLALNRDYSRRRHEKKILDLRVRFDALSSREKRVMLLVTSGLMNKQVAGEIGVSEATVKVHRHNIMKKIGARSLADLVKIAEALGVASEVPTGSDHAGKTPIYG